MTFFSVGIGNVLLELGVAGCPLKPLACKGGISDCDVDQGCYGCDVGFPGSPVQHLCLLWHAQWELARGLV